MIQFNQQESNLWPLLLRSCSVVFHEMVSQVQSQEGTQESHKEERLLYSQVLEELVKYTTKGDHIRGCQWNQASGEMKKRWREKTDAIEPRGSAFIGGQDGVYKQKAFHWYIWMTLGQSQGRARKGSCVRAQPYHSDTPGRLAVCSQPVYGDVEAGKKKKRKF